MDFSLCTSLCRKSAGIGAGAGGVETGAGRVEMCTDDSSGNCNENRCNP